MSNVWFSSDWHLGHKNIVRGISDWEDKNECRDFKSLEEHDDRILLNINKYADWNDHIYFLGDFSFGGLENIYRYRQRIDCQNIHFIVGNHDIHIAKNACLKDNVPVQGLFTSYNQYLEKKIGGDKFFMCHYAMLTWHKAHRGCMMLHGHSHGSLKLPGDYYKYKIMDVGIDCHPEFRPFHIDEVRKIMDGKLPLGTDHHQENKKR